MVSVPFRFMYSLRVWFLVSVLFRLSGKVLVRVWVQVMVTVQFT